VRHLPHDKLVLGVEELLMQLTTKTNNNLPAPFSRPVTDSASRRPAPEVPEKKPRRRFTAQYKLRVLAEVDACTHTGEVGAILRREGLYSSNLTTWRRQREKGMLQGLTPKKRGRKKKESSPLARRIAELERENRHLSGKLKQAETIIEVQKKISEVLGISQPDSNGKNS